MKRNISDLLDTYADETMEFDSPAPLSSSRIKELTMNKLPQKKMQKRHLPIRLFLVAAMIAVLSVTALAASYVLGAGTLLQDFFTEKGSNLTTGQLEEMDQMGKTFAGGVTSNGTTITPVAAIADEHVYYLRLRIEGPEEVVLPDYNNETDGYYQLFGRNAGEDMTLDLQPGAYRSSGYEARFNWLPDEDPTDHVKEVVVLLKSQAGTDLKFNDHVSKNLTIHGLWLQSPAKEYTQLLSGEFTFDIGLHYDSKVIPFNCEGLTWRDEENGYTSTLQDLTISPLTLSFRYTATAPKNDRVRTSPGPFEVVLKDGRSVPMRDAPGGGTECYLVFEYPLDLTQVAYVSYGDHTIPVALNEIRYHNNP